MAKPTLEVQDFSIACPTTSTQLVPQNYRRKWLSICNAGANNVFLQLGKDAVVNEGIRLQGNTAALVGGGFIFDSTLYWDGSVYGIADSAASQLSIVEVFQRES